MKLFLNFLPALLLLAAPAALFADGAEQEELYGEERAVKSHSTDRSSANFKKTEKFLPGEEVTTTTGKKVKVWSTKGPVEVSQPPEPFEDSEKRLPANVELEVNEQLRDKDDRRHHHHHHRTGADDGR